MEWASSTSATDGEGSGAPNNDQLALCCQLMGSSDETYADPQYGSGEPLSV